MQYLGKAIRAAALLAIAAYSTAGFAGSAEVTAGDGSRMTYEYTDTMVRMNSDEPNSWMVLRDGHAYMVSINDGQPMVIDANQAWRMASGIIGNAAPNVMNEQLQSIEATGRKETHAGVVGEVYKLRIQDSDGKVEEYEAVLSEDPRAVAFRDALITMSRTMAEAMGRTDLVDVKQSVPGKLMSMNKGVLRYGDDMTITALSNEPVDPSRFELPAQPTDMSGLGAILGGMNRGAPPPEDGVEDAPAGSGQPAQQAPTMRDVGRAIGELFGR
ncbi:MAG: hypothetical protein R3228_08265 [Halioglobus sp.]|nr:hypothetical protein [Halioglobus sp.]